MTKILQVSISEAQSMIAASHDYDRVEIVRAIEDKWSASEILNFIGIAKNKYKNKFNEHGQPSGNKITAIKAVRDASRRGVVGVDHNYSVMGLAEAKWFVELICEDRVDVPQ